VKTHYELLGLDSSADADAIKKAFRREIARYHPDKVIHLGDEFQKLAANRAAELTVAYKTLANPALREEYDASLVAGLPPPHVPQPPRTAPREAAPPPSTTARHEPMQDQQHRAAAGKARFASERADRDVILKRALTSRVIGIVEALYGTVETPAVRGFDLAMVPVAKARFLGAAPPRVLVKVVDVVDGAAIIEAFKAASRARVHAGKSPVVVLLFSREIAPQSEISKANDVNARQRKTDGGPDEVAVVVVNTSDWSCRLPPNCSAVVHKLTDQICS
jgi:hypothetical protein